MSFVSIKTRPFSGHECALQALATTYLLLLKYFIASGKSKKDAEQNAATECLKNIK